MKFIKVQKENGVAYINADSIEFVSNLSFGKQPRCYIKTHSGEGITCTDKAPWEVMDMLERCAHTTEKHVIVE